MVSVSALKPGVSANGARKNFAAARSSRAEWRAKGMWMVVEMGIVGCGCGGTHVLSAEAARFGCTVVVMLLEVNWCIEVIHSG